MLALRPLKEAFHFQRMSVQSAGELLPWLGRQHWSLLPKMQRLLAFWSEGTFGCCGGSGLVRSQDVAVIGCLF